MTSRSVRIAAIDSPSSTTTAPTPRSAIAAAASPMRPVSGDGQQAPRHVIGDERHEAILRCHRGELPTARDGTLHVRRRHLRGARADARHLDLPLRRVPALERTPRRVLGHARRRTSSSTEMRFAGSTARTAIVTFGAASVASADRASSFGSRLRVRVGRSRHARPTDGTSHRRPLVLPPGRRLGRACPTTGSRATTSSPAPSAAGPDVVANSALSRPRPFLYSPA